MCLQSVYGLDLQDKACVAKYGASRSLQVAEMCNITCLYSLFLDYQELFQQDEQATQLNKEEAEKLKNQGDPYS